MLFSKAKVVGSTPTGSTYTRLAQSVERTPFKRVVVGSSPTSGAEYKRRLPPRGIFWVVVIQLSEMSSLPTVVLVANCDDLEPNMVGRCIFVNNLGSTQLPG